MSDSIPPDKLVRVYVKMRTAHETLTKEYDTKIKDLETLMKQVKSAMLGYLTEQHLETANTSEGMFYRTTKKRYWTNDWDSMGKFIVENKIPELLEKRLHQGNTQAFIEENPDLLPPGLNVDSEYSITVRAIKK